MSETIILIGAPGSGKTCCGEALARLLKWSFVDTDNLIERRSGLSVPEIFSIHGESRFRQLERQELESLARDAAGGRLDRAVIGTGGGLPVAPGNMELLCRIGSVVHLRATIPELVSRLSPVGGRPLLGQTGGNKPGDEQLTQRLQNLLSDRAACYGRAPYEIDTTGFKPEEIASAIVKLLNIPA